MRATTSSLSHPNAGSSRKEAGFGQLPPCEDKPLLCWLTDMVCTVRNNLFHGGKFPFARIKDPARDPDLLKHSLTILEACLELNPKVKGKFMEPNE
jgi:hypothetical protein